LPLLRAYGYLGVAGVVWLVEGALFGYFLRFVLWQLMVLLAIYTALLVVALRALLKNLNQPQVAGADVAVWRLVALAPMLVVIVGSFASLPILLIVALLGKIL
jgi:hypothetical protein